MQDANLMVCQGRKVVYLLSFGKVHSKGCFVREPPTPSFRKDDQDAEEGFWKSIVIPNGWKVALIVDNEVWTAEVSYDHNERDLAQYQFCRMNETGEVAATSDWCYTPSGAFKSASMITDGTDEHAWGRHNGKLYLGCTYDFPQRLLRQHFKQQVEAGTETWNDEVKQMLVDWLDPVKQHDPARKLSSLDRRKRPGSRSDAEGRKKASDSRSVSSNDSYEDSPSNTYAMSLNLPVIDPNAAFWMNQVYLELHPANVRISGRLQHLFSLIPAPNPSPNDHMRATTSAPQSILNPQEQSALLLHVVKQLNFMLLESYPQMILQQSRSNFFPTIPLGLIEKVLDVIPGKHVSGLKHSRFEELLDFIETIEVFSSVVFENLKETMGISPLTDMFVRLSYGANETVKSALNFINNRMMESGLSRMELFQVGMSSAEFTRIITCVPKASLLRHFVFAMRKVPLASLLDPAAKQLSGARVASNGFSHILAPMGIPTQSAHPSFVMHGVPWNCGPISMGMEQPTTPVAVPTTNTVLKAGSVGYEG